MMNGRDEFESGRGICYCKAVGESVRNWVQLERGKYVGDKMGNFRE